MAGLDVRVSAVCRIFGLSVLYRVFQRRGYRVKKTRHRKRRGRMSAQAAVEDPQPPSFRRSCRNGVQNKKIAGVRVALCCADRTGRSFSSIDGSFARPPLTNWSIFRGAAVGMAMDRLFPIVGRTSDFDAFCRGNGTSRQRYVALPVPCSAFRHAAAIVRDRDSRHLCDRRDRRRRPECICDAARVPQAGGEQPRRSACGCTRS